MSYTVIYESQGVDRQQDCVIFVELEKYYLLENSFFENR